MMNRNGFDLMLSLALAPAQVAPHGPNYVWDADIRVTDIKAEQVALGEAGEEIVRGPERVEYGMTELEVFDPNGHRIRFGQ